MLLTAVAIAVATRVTSDFYNYPIRNSKMAQHALVRKLPAVEQ